MTAYDDAINAPSETPIRDAVFALCAALGHDPEHVDLITIDPADIVVENAEGGPSTLSRLDSIETATTSTYRDWRRR